MTFTATKAVLKALAKGTKVTLKVTLKGVSGTTVATTTTVKLSGPKR